MPLKLADLVHTAEPASDLDGFLARIERSAAVVAGWDEARQRRITELRDAVEALHAEALRRLIRGLQDIPAADARLRELMADDVVYAVLRHLGVLKASLQERIEAVLAAVRPQLSLHGGGVELLDVLPPDAVRLRWLGSCAEAEPMTRHLRTKLADALGVACPEITRILSADEHSALEVNGER